MKKSFTLFRNFQAVSERGGGGHDFTIVRNNRLRLFNLKMNEWELMFLIQNSNCKGVHFRNSWVTFFLGSYFKIVR